MICCRRESVWVAELAHAQRRRFIPLSAEDTALQSYAKQFPDKFFPAAVISDFHRADNERLRPQTCTDIVEKRKTQATNLVLIRTTPFPRLPSTMFTPFFIFFLMCFLFIMQHNVIGMFNQKKYIKSNLFLCISHTPVHF